MPQRAAKRGRQFEVDGFAAARGLAKWKQQVRTAWPGVELRLANTAGTHIDFSNNVTLEVDVTLNGLCAGDIRLESVVSRQLCSSLTVPVRQFAERGVAESGLRTVGNEHVYIQTFEVAGQPANGVQRFRVELRPPWCGDLIYEVRASPWHRGLSHPYEMGLMRWI